MVLRIPRGGPRLTTSEHGQGALEPEWTSSMSCSSIAMKHNIQATVFLYDKASSETRFNDHLLQWYVVALEKYSRGQHCPVPSHFQLRFTN